VALTHLLDTSVLKRLHEQAVRDIVESGLTGNTLGRPRICALEVGYSARNAAEWDRLQQALEALTVIETTVDHVRRALQVQRLLADRSQRGGKIPDLLVAAAAEEHGLVVLHYDADFDMIAGVTGQRCEWIVTAGSID
jgi:hypothetical protein